MTETDSYITFNISTHLRRLIFAIIVIGILLYLGYTWSAFGLAVSGFLLADLD